MESLNYKSAAVLMGLTLLLSGCGVDTTADMNAREQERDREKAQTLANQYKLAVGLYQGSTQSADVFLSTNFTMVNNGTTSNAASISGALVMIPKVATTEGSRPIQNIYPFYNGIFDSHTGILSFNVEQTGNSSTVSCKVDAKMNFTCYWDVSLRKPLYLKKTAATSIAELTDTSKADIVYVGNSDGLNYVIQFQAATTVRPGSQVPQPSINGGITWFIGDSSKPLPAENAPRVDFSIQDGTYDPVNDEINLVLKDDAQSKVVCAILSKGNLKCNLYMLVPKKVTVQRLSRR